MCQRQKGCLTVEYLMKYITVVFSAHRIDSVVLKPTPVFDIK